MNSNFVISLITIAFSAFFFIYSMTLPSPEDAEKIGPGGWPSTILVLMFILGLTLLLRTILQKKKETAAIKTNIEGDHTEMSKDVKPNHLSKNHYIVTGILVLYAIVVPIIGFLFASFLLLLSLAWLFGMKRKLNLVVTSVVSSLFFIYLFTIVLQMPLPRGWWLFREISLLFY